MTALRLAPALLLAGCTTLGGMLGMQPTTLNLDRDAANQAIGRAHQACKDGKLPKEACAQIDLLVKQSAAKGGGGSLDVGALMGLLTSFGL